MSDIVTIVNGFTPQQKADLAAFLIKEYQPIRSIIMANATAKATTDANTMVSSGSITITQLEQLF